MIFVDTLVGWLCGVAFWYGWSSGSLSEHGLPMMAISPTIWVAWPLYLLGRACGQRYTARKLAPERMRQKLMQESAQTWPQQAVSFTPQKYKYPTNATYTPGWFGGGASGTP